MAIKYRNISFKTEAIHKCIITKIEMAINFISVHFKRILLSGIMQIVMLEYTRGSTQVTLLDPRNRWAKITRYVRV